MLVIKNTKIYTSAGTVHEKGDILIKDGKIEKVGGSIEADCEIIDGEGLITLPGLVDGHNHAASNMVNRKKQDFNEMSGNCVPQMDILYSIDFNSEDFKFYYKGGITTSGIIPGSGNVVGGVGVAIKGWGKSNKERVLRHPMALKMALGLNPKNAYGKQRQEAPMTRMSIAQIIIDTFRKAQEYMKKRELPENDPKRPVYNQGMENVCMVLRKEMPIKVHSEQFDMLMVFKIAEMFDINFTIEHGWGASDFYDDFSESKHLVGILFGPMSYMPRFPGEIGKQDPYSLIELDRRGVNCSLITDGPSFGAEALLLQGGEIIRSGGNVEKVIEMMTINPAKTMGVDKRIGSIEVGKDADFAIFQGMPCVDTNARVKYTLIDGEIVHKSKH